MLPSIFRENLFDDWFGFPTFPEIRDADRKLYGRHAAHEMKTDVHEHEDHYTVDVDLPGFKKEEIRLELENGMLTVHAAKNVEQEKTDKAGKIIRQERYTGAMERSFYVGEALTEEDIGAKFENGVLTLNVPKKDVKKLPEKKVIQIEG